MAKPFVETIIPATNSVADGGEIPTGAVIHQSCDICKKVGNGYHLNGHNKYNAYEIVGVIMIKPTSGSTEQIGVSVMQDGQQVAGGKFYATVGASIAIPVYCMVTTECGTPSSIALNASGEIDILGGVLRVGTR